MYDTSHTTELRKAHEEQELRTAAVDLMYGCWGAFGALWAAGAVVAGSRAPSQAARSDRDRASRAGALAALVVLATPGALWRPFVVAAPSLRLAGAVVLSAATVATLWARIALGSMWSSTVVSRERHQLRTNGPYAITRHPIYTGVLVMLIGTALVEGIGRWALLVVAVAVVLTTKARAEERLLQREFGDAYRRYQADVPSFLPRPTPRRRTRRPPTSLDRQR